MKEKEVKLFISNVVSIVLRNTHSYKNTELELTKLLRTHNIIETRKAIRK
jgi:hypothetical protein